MPKILPLRPSVGSYDFTCALGAADVEQTFVWRVRWNGRDKAWFLSVLDSGLVPIISNMKIVLGVYLGRQSVHPLFTKGVLLCRPTNKDRRDPTFDDLGVRVQVVYFTFAEMIQEILGSGLSNTEAQ